MHPVIRKASPLAALKSEEQGALLRALGPTVRIRAGEDILSDGDRPGVSTMLLEGVAFRYKALADGRRQILSFQITGDVLDLQTYVTRRMDHGVRALGDCKIATIPHAAVSSLIERYPGIALACWRNALLDSAISREWMVALARRPAHERIAHLFCELTYRLKAAGVAEGDGYRLPLTQALLAEAAGLSAIHVNRVLKMLRNDGLATLSKGVLTVNDWEELQRAGHFDPTYLRPD